MISFMINRYSPSARGAQPMTGIIKEAAYPAVTNLLSTKYVPAGVKSRTHAETILDHIRLTDPQNADALAKRLQDGKQTIDQLRSGKARAGESRKAAAREKIERIKEQIKMLKTMGGDPKAVAKQIARLAKELAAASREYASGAGSVSQNLTGVDGSENNMNGSSTPSNVVAEGTTVGDSSAKTDISATVGSAETDATGRKSAKAEHPAQESDTTVTGAILAEGARQYQDAQRQKIKEEIENYVAEIKQKFSEGDEKREVVHDLRTLAAQLKEMAKRIKQLLHQKREDTENQDFTQTNQALAEVEKSISDITGNNTAIINVFT